MPHFFCEQVDGNQVLLNGENAHHIERVLRMKVGQALSIATADGMRHDGVIQSFSDAGVHIAIHTTKQGDTEPSVGITLYQALPKGDKMELILQKAVELGVTKIVPVLTKRCVSRPDAKSMAKKVTRYRKIVEAAAKQSGRGVLPEVDDLITMAQLCDIIGEHEQAIVCYEGGGKRLVELVKTNCQDIGLVIGSEGGFEAEEVEALCAAGAQAATLGKLILRCETAPLAAIAIIMQITGNI